LPQNQKRISHDCIFEGRASTRAADRVIAASRRYPGVTVIALMGMTIGAAHSNAGQPAQATCTTTWIAFRRPNASAQAILRAYDVDLCLPTLYLCFLMN
jgi:hypothetical protein